MKRRNYFSFALLSVLCLAAGPTLAQDEHDDGVGTRGAFLATRPSGPERKNNSPSGGASTAASGRINTGGGQTGRTSNSDGRVAANSGRNTKKSSGASVAANNQKKSGNKGTSKDGETETANNAAAITPANNEGANFSTANFSPGSIGLGYTLYMRDANGDALRVDPSRVFHAGESLRIVLEANTDGYLYVFHTENEKEPQMIFPDARLGRGNNFVRAHVPYEVPSNMEADERLRWFVFDGTPASERLYIVVTRQPLADIPAGETLVKFCQTEGNSCPWGPTKGIWAQLKNANDKDQVAVSRIKDEGRPQTSGERDAATRGLGLSQDAPGPSIIRMTASSTTGVLITAVDLVHK